MASTCVGQPRFPPTHHPRFRRIHGQTGEHDQVVAVAAPGPVEVAGAGDQPQRGRGDRPEHGRGREARLGIAARLLDHEPQPGPVGPLDQHRLARPQLPQPVEHRRPGPGVDVPGDHRRPSLPRRRPPGEPPGPPEVARDLHGASWFQAQPDQPGRHPDRRNHQPHRRHPRPRGRHLLGQVANLKPGSAWGVPGASKFPGAGSSAPPTPDPRACANPLPVPGHALTRLPVPGHALTRPPVVGSPGGGA